MVLKSKKTNLIRIVSFIFLLYIIFSLAMLSVNAEDTEYVFRFGYGAASNSFQGKQCELFKELIEKYTDGKAEVKLYPSDQLGKRAAQVEATILGSQDFVLTLDNAVPLVPELNVLNMPFVFQDRHRYERISRGPIGQELLDLLQDHGLVGLGLWELGFLQVANNVRPIYTPEDAKGLNIRVPQNPIRVGVWKAIGANPDTIAYSELFSALQMGVFDGFDNPLMLIRDAHFEEVTKYLTILGYNYKADIVLMCKKRWDVLPPNIQSAIRIAAQDVAIWSLDEGEKLAADHLEYLSTKMEVNYADVDSFRKAIKPMYESYEYPELLNRVLEVVK